MERRTFLTDLAATAVAPIVAADLISHGFAAALRGGPTEDAWRVKLDSYGRDYMTMGAAESCEVAIAIRVRVEITTPHSSGETGWLTAEAARQRPAT
jgi:hypothetical protein